MSDAEIYAQLRRMKARRLLVEFHQHKAAGPRQGRWYFNGPGVQELAASRDFAVGYATAAKALLDA